MSSDNLAARSGRQITTERANRRRHHESYFIDLLAATTWRLVQTLQNRPAVRRRAADLVRTRDEQPTSTTNSSSTLSDKVIRDFGRTACTYQDKSITTRAASARPRERRRDCWPYNPGGLCKCAPKGRRSGATTGCRPSLYRPAQAPAHPLLTRPVPCAQFTGLPFLAIDLHEVNEWPAVHDGNNAYDSRL